MVGVILFTTKNLLTQTLRGSGGCGLKHSPVQGFVQSGTGKLRQPCIEDIWIMDSQYNILQNVSQKNINTISKLGLRENAPWVNCLEQTKDFSTLRN